MTFRTIIGALVLGVAMCNSGYAFEWLDRLIGIDLDNSEAPQYYPQAPQAYYPQSTPTYQPYSTGYAPQAGSYPATTSNAYRPVAPPQGVAPQAGYRTVYQSVPITQYEQVTTYDSYGYRVTTMRPVVTYQMQPRVVPNTANQPAYVPAQNFAPAGSTISPGK